MATKQKEKPEYTSTECNSVVYTIEAVYGIDEPDY